MNDSAVTSTNTGTKLQFLPDENAGHDDATLYTVDLNELQPLNVPFMMPGIYKKIHMPFESQNSIMTGTTTNNVIIAEPMQTGDITQTKPATKEIMQHKEVLEENTQNINTNALDMLAKKLLKTTNEADLIIDRQRNEIIHLPTGNRRKKIYRIITPSDLGLCFDNDHFETSLATTVMSSKTNKPKAKLGRPRKQCSIGEDKPVNSLPTVTTNCPPAEAEKPTQRTRSGRVVHMKYENIIIASKETTTELLAELKDSDYKCKTEAPEAASSTTDAVNSEGEATVAKAKRYVPPESICAGCNKIFLGKRMQRHLAQHPDHIKPFAIEPAPVPACTTTATQCSNENVSLFSFLINKLHSNPQLSEDQRADLFLNELDDFVHQLQLRSTRLIHNTTGMHTISGRSSRVLGIPEGQYALDLTALVTQPESDANCLGNDEQLIPPQSVNTRSLDYTGISLDGTLTDEAAQKLNLSAGGKLLPPSEESLLRAVDDLVQTNIKKLNVTTTTTGYDHVSDNAVEAVTIMKETKNVEEMQATAPILDLSVEFFQFNNN